LYECARSYIQDTHPNGSEFWTSVERHIEFVLSLPNGWEGAQQSQMRHAAVLAGLVTDGDAQARLQFVTEGEASLHFCVKKGLMTDAVTVRSPQAKFAYILLTIWFASTEKVSSLSTQVGELSISALTAGQQHLILSKKLRHPNVSLRHRQPTDTHLMCMQVVCKVQFSLLVVLAPI
jgi:hypothetical protein